jgi:hypothetical protein
MIKYDEARRKPRVFRQLTGLALEEFDQLLAAFQQAYDKAYPPAEGASGPGGRPPVLRTHADKLFFILFYFRHYPTQEVLAFLFGFSQGQACQWIHRLTPIVNQALGHELALPARSAADLTKLLKECSGLACIIDGTERPIRRPQDKDARRSDYSGKKKRHTKKNIIITQKATGRILGLGQTQPGSKHDKKCVDEEGYTFPPGTKLYQDTGFQGFAPQGATVHQPTKKPRKKELTVEQKEANKKISSERIGVEHSIGGVKIFRIVADVFRGIKEGFVDVVMETACGLFTFCRMCRLST